MQKVTTLHSHLQDPLTTSFRLGAGRAVWTALWSHRNQGFWVRQELCPSPGTDADRKVGVRKPWTAPEPGPCDSILNAAANSERTAEVRAHKWAEPRGRMRRRLASRAT